MNTPIPLDLTDLATNYPAQQYRIDLLTAVVPDGAPSAYSDLKIITDQHYAGQDTYVDLVDADESVVSSIRFQNVWFDGTSYDSNYTVTGWALSAVFDDGITPIAVLNFEQAITVGPASNPVAVPASLDLYDLSAVALNWN
jgi:hypothetical protein